MNKKGYILKLLTTLDGKWPMAAGLKLLVEQNVLSDQSIDGLQRIFAESIKQMSDKKAQESLLKSRQFLQKLQEREIAHHESENKELDIMLQNI